MDLSRRIRLGLMVLGLSVGTVHAAEPAPAPMPSAPTPMPSAATPGETTAPLPVSSPLAVAVSGDDAGAGGDRSGWLGGAGIYLLQPYFSNNPAYVLQVTNGSRTDVRTDVHHHMEAAPQVWLGYMADNGLGFRARWWYFREGSDQTAAAPNGGVLFSAAPLGASIQNVSNLEVTSKLQLQAADLEILDEVAAGRWRLLLAAGLRLAQVNQTYNAFATMTGTPTLLSSDAFQGVGPTLAVEARRELGGTGVSAYANARGAVVFGSAHQSAVQPEGNVGAEDHRDVGMPIGEVELGLEYSRCLGRSRLFGQIALVGQDWFGAGSASRSSPNITPGGAVSNGAYSGDSDIEFLGLSLRLGVNY